MSNTNYILRGLDTDGRECFYTGRAGDAWVSPERTEAFGYPGQESARRRAMQFNRMVAVHGLWFIAVPADYRAPWWKWEE